MATDSAGDSLQRTMPIDLASELPTLLPKAVAWAERVAAQTLQTGTALDSAQAVLARDAGVRAPHRVRLCVVDAMPAPEDPVLREAAQQVGLLGPDSIGLTLGHAVYIRRDFDSDENLLRHELRHVHQYECYGSIKAFLSVYLPQIVQFGYRNAPLEIDARRHVESGSTPALPGQLQCPRDTDA